MGVGYREMGLGFRVLVVETSVLAFVALDFLHQ